LATANITVAAKSTDTATGALVHAFATRVTRVWTVLSALRHTIGVGRCATRRRAAPTTVQVQEIAIMPLALASASPIAVVLIVCSEFAKSSINFARSAPTLHA